MIITNFNRFVNSHLITTSDILKTGSRKGMPPIESGDYSFGGHGPSLRRNMALAGGCGIILGDFAASGHRDNVLYYRPEYSAGKVIHDESDVDRSDQ